MGRGETGITNKMFWDRHIRDRHNKLRRFGLETPKDFALKKGVIKTMNIHRSHFGIACRVAAFSFLMAGTALLVQAQQTPSAASTVKAPTLLAAESGVPGELARWGGESAPADLALASTSSSSSSSSFDAADSDARFDLLGSSQPPPRRRYGRPSYASGNSNADGSPKYTFLAGMGLSDPIGNTHKYETPSYGFQFGGGRNFNKLYGLLLQFDYDHFGLQGVTIANQAYIYNYCTVAEFNAAECSPEGPAPTGSAAPIDGNNHVWSFTLNPTFTLPTDGSLGAYAVLGGGFYHKVTNFTTPTLGEYCYYYCEEIEQNATFDHYTSNAVGVSGGFGLTYKFSKFSNERFYMEARYVFMPNSQRTGVTSANVATSPLSATNFYPANSNRTTFIPVKFGLRF